MRRAYILVILGILVVGGIFLSSVSVKASTALQQATATPPIQVTPTFDSNRLAQPSTVVPPVQADNGAQVYWGMCAACHGDKGQGLTDEWRNSYPLEKREALRSQR